MRHVRLTLSSPWTPLFGFGPPVVANAIAVGLLIGWIVDPASAPFEDVVLLLIAAGFLTWYCAGLKTLHQQGDSLVIAAGGGEVRVPAALIDRVDQFRWARPGVGTIHFLQRTPVGRTVSFVPEASALSLIGLGWLDDGVSRHLRRLANEARARDADPGRGRRIAARARSTPLQRER